MDNKNETEFTRRVRSLLRWLQPGLGVKRWFIVIFLGNTLLAVGFTLFLLDIYRKAPDTWWLPILSIASLRPLPRLLRVLIFGSIGVGTIIWGVIGLNKSLLGPFLRPGNPVVDSLEKYRTKKSGPHIVAIGGGHGLAALLRGLKNISHNLDAVVTVADDGGSSGRLRDTLGILPPGDIRNCLAALSNDEDLLTHLFQYRFANEDGSLKGHSFGNLFISSLAELTGSFEQAIAESGRVLAVNGRVLPSTLENVNLVADILHPDNGREIRINGESKITKTKGNIRRVMLEPENPPAFPDAIRAILSAELIVIGPGSLYTSILPNLLVRDIAAAIRASQALKIFVCNVATQKGETDHYTCSDHIRVLEEHIGGNLFDIVLVNNESPQKYNERVQGVQVDQELSLNFNVYEADLIDKENPWRHDSSKLKEKLIDLLEERTGPLIM
jgi:uncharacterized cofD-like protein